MSGDEGEESASPGESAPGSADGPDWRRESRLALSTPWGRVGVDGLRRPDGEYTRKGWVEADGSVAVVAVHDDQVVMVEEYRPRLGETVLSCPVGGVEGEESFEAAAERELREETGFVAERVERLAVEYPVSWVRKRRGVVYADGLTRTEPDPEDGEFMAVRTLPVEAALAAAREGVATGWTLTPLLLAREDGLL